MDVDLVPSSCLGSAFSGAGIGVGVGYGVVSGVGVGMGVGAGISVGGMVGVVQAPSKIMPITRVNSSLVILISASSLSTYPQV